MEKHIKTLRNFCKENGVVAKSFRFDNEDNQFFYFKTRENKKTIIFVHGLHRDKFFPVIELLIKFLENGYSVVTFDLPGHGENEKLFSLGECAKDFSKIISFLKIRLKIPKEDLILVGQSMGGFLSLLESTNNSVSGVVSISTPYKIDPSSFIFLESFSLMNPIFLRQLKYYSLSQFFSPKIIKRKKYSKEKLAEMTKEAEEVSFGILDKIKKSKIPLLQIHGRMDMFVPFSQAKAINKNYGGEKTTFFPFFSNHFNLIFKKRNIEKILNWIHSKSS